jgi:CRP/FNR family transcriptional regulator
MRKPPIPRCDICTAQNPGGLCRLRTGPAGRFAGSRAAQFFKRGQPLFHEGWPPHSLYVVHSGRVRVFRTWSNGEEQVLRLLGPGEIVGYRPIFADEPYGASADAVEDSAICVIPREVVVDRLRREPDLALHMLAKLAVELRISEDLLMDLIRRPVRERTARLLMGLLRDAEGTPEPDAILSRQLPRKDLARMIGTTPETFSRVLRGFAQRGIVDLTRDRIRVRDLALLRRVAGERDGR